MPDPCGDGGREGAAKGCVARCNDRVAVRAWVGQHDGMGSGWSGAAAFFSYALSALPAGMTTW
jgi:hypothetical protein